MEELVHASFALKLCFSSERLELAGFVVTTKTTEGIYHKSPVGCFLAAEATASMKSERSSLNYAMGMHLC